MAFNPSNSTTPDALWVNVSTGFQCLDRKFLGQLARFSEVSHWAYSQTADEPCSLEIAMTMLHDYIKQCDRPLHLMGHSTGGLLALLYTRRFPHRVKSLTLLGVGVNPAVDWQAHYYAQLEFLHCKRSLVLAQIAYALFGNRPPTGSPTVRTHARTGPGPFPLAPFSVQAGQHLPRGSFRAAFGVRRQ